MPTNPSQLRSRWRYLAAVGLGALALAVFGYYALASRAFRTWLAEQGNLTAAHSLCFDYTYGEHGVQSDDREAVKWCRSAALRGYPSSETLLAEHFESGRGLQTNVDSAVYWYRAAAAQGHPHAQYVVAWYILTGLISARTVAEPESLLSASAAQGYDRAREVLDSLRRRKRA